MIEYLKGDATRPVGDGTKIIAHVCNDVGAWGAGFVLALSKRWKKPEKMFRHQGRMQLGQVDLVQVEDDVWVANMCAQAGIHWQNGVPPIRYDALEKCLDWVGFEAGQLVEEDDVSIHMPRVGCGLAGGKWERVEPIIEATLVRVGIPVYVYDLR